MENVETITIKEVEAWVKENGPHPLLAGTLTKMRMLSQGLLEKAEFDKAARIHYCSVCVKNTVSKKGDMCKECLAENDGQRARELLEKKWQTLADALNDEAGCNVYEFNLEELEEGEKKGPDWKLNITREVKLDDDSTVTYTLKREDIYSGSGWSSRISGYAIRIHARPGEGATKLKRDFDSKDVAKHLHKRIAKIINEENQRVQNRESRRQREIKEQAAVKKDFPTAQGLVKIGDRYAAVIISRGFTYRAAPTFKGFYKLVVGRQKYNHSTILLGQREYKEFTSLKPVEIIKLIDTLSAYAEKAKENEDNRYK